MNEDAPPDSEVDGVDGCELCAGTGTMTWQQPVPGPDGMFRLVEMRHPCVNGCSGWFKVPVAEQGDVLAAESSVPGMCGNVAQVNSEHRTEWFRPLSH
ncbi:hypothetical protein [Lentzea sp. NPDC051838]|uniref:hypothetical protein n=1 Tax=Lentzea sp. NPDC051838 TaxID=3154849 RepID=UPI0034265EA5